MSSLLSNHFMQLIFIYNYSVFFLKLLSQTTTEKYILIVFCFLFCFFSLIKSRAVTIRRERTAVYRGTATLYRGTYRDILQIMYL